MSRYESSQLRRWIFVGRVFLLFLIVDIRIHNKVAKWKLFTVTTTNVLSNKDKDSTIKRIYIY